jgi:hypothetical protein
MSTSLIKSIISGSTVFSNLSEAEKMSIYDTSIASNDPMVLEFLTNSFTGIYDYNVYKPYWLLSDFYAPIWHIEIKDNGKIFKRVIDWSSTTLSDNLRLTDKRHAPLLNAFKYWITATDNPRENAGRFKKGIYVNISILSIISMINTILIHGEFIRLAEFHLAEISDDFIMSLLIRLCEYGVHEGFYDFTNRTRKYLLENISTITDYEAELFSQKHPFISRPLLSDEISLGLSVEERIKACCFLSKKGYYEKHGLSNGSSYMSECLRGRNTVLIDLVFENTVIPFQMGGFTVFSELILFNTQKSVTEYKGIPCVDESDILSEVTIRHYLSNLKLLTRVTKRDGVSKLPVSAFKSVTISRIKEQINIREKGRYKSLPSKIVFDLIEQCYEFTHKYQDSILNSVLSILIAGKDKSSEKHSNTRKVAEFGSTEKIAWLRTDAIDLIDSNLRKLGVDRVFLSSSEDDYFIKIRSNKSLFSLYSVLIGSIQVLTGVIMAKRIDELISLKSHANLYPQIDPSSKKGQHTDYQLISELKKSGSGGEFGRNVITKRPISRSIALIVWKLEEFNKLVLEYGLNKSKISLFNALSRKSLRLLDTHPGMHVSE